MTHPFLEVPSEKVVGRVDIKGVGWSKEVSASRKKSTTREICRKLEGKKIHMFFSFF